MASSATVLALVTSLGMSTLADAAEIGVTLTETLREIGHDPRGWLVDFGFITPGTVADGADRTQLELRTADEITHLLALFFDDRELTRESDFDLSVHAPDWRDDVGAPKHYVVEDQTDRILRYHPQPTLQRTGTFADASDAPAVIYSHYTVTAIPEFLVLPLALLVLAREFERESAHRDMAVAAVARGIAVRYLDMVA